MVTIYKKVLIPERVIEKKDYTICDLCSDKIKYAGAYNVEEVTINYRTGCSYPEGSWGEEYDFDICPSCFMNKIIPFLKEQGVDINPKSYDY